jgi:hypothetical protein
MEKLSKVALVVAVLALVVGGFAFLKAPTIVTNTNTVEKQLAGVSSDSVHKFFGDGITVGGLDLATTTGTTLTTYLLTAKELRNHTIRINPSVDLTLQIDATSTAALVPNIGDEYTFLLQNSSTTAASAITLDNKDTSVLPFNVEATGADLVVSGKNWAKITIVRTGVAGTDFIKFMVTEFVPG